MTFRSYDTGALFKGFNMFNPAVVTTTNDATAQNGYVVDRQFQNATGDLGDLYQSAKIVVPASYSLAAAETVTIRLEVQHSDTTGSTTFATYANKDGSTAVTDVFGDTASTAAQTGNVVTESDIDLRGAKRYLRISITPTLSAASADTVDIAGVAVFGGGNYNPAA